MLLLPFGERVRIVFMSEDMKLLEVSALDSVKVAYRWTLGLLLVSADAAGIAPLGIRIILALSLSDSC